MNRDARLPPSNAGGISPTGFPFTDDTCKRMKTLWKSDVADEADDGHSASFGSANEQNASQKRWDVASAYSVFADPVYPHWKLREEKTEESSRDRADADTSPFYLTGPGGKCFPGLVRKTAPSIREDSTSERNKQHLLKARGPMQSGGSLLGEYKPPNSQPEYSISCDAEVAAKRNKALERQKKVTIKSSEQMDGYIGKDKSVADILAFIEGEDDSKPGKSKKKKKKGSASNGGSSKPKKAGKSKEEGAEAAEEEGVVSDAVEAVFTVASEVGVNKLREAAESKKFTSVDVDSAMTDETCQENQEVMGAVIQTTGVQPPMQVETKCPLPISVAEVKSTGVVVRPEVEVDMCGSSVDFDVQLGKDVVIEEFGSCDGDAEVSAQRFPGSCGEVNRQQSGVAVELLVPTAQETSLVRNGLNDLNLDRSEDALSDVVPPVELTSTIQNVPPSASDGPARKRAAVSDDKDDDSSGTSFKTDFYSVAPLTDSNDEATVTGLINDDDVAFQIVTSKKLQRQPKQGPLQPTPSPASVRQQQRPPHPGQQKRVHFAAEVVRSDPSLVAVATTRLQSGSDSRRSGRNVSVSSQGHPGSVATTSSPGFVRQREAKLAPVRDRSDSDPGGRGQQRRSDRGSPQPQQQLESRSGGGGVAPRRPFSGPKTRSRSNGDPPRPPQQQGQGARLLSGSGQGRRHGGRGRVRLRRGRSSNQGKEDEQRQQAHPAAVEPKKKKEEEEEEERELRLDMEEFPPLVVADLPTESVVAVAEAVEDANDVPEDASSPCENEMAASCVSDEAGTQTGTDDNVELVRNEVEPVKGEEGTGTKNSDQEATAVAKPACPNKPRATRKKVKMVDVETQTYKLDSLLSDVITLRTCKVLDTPGRGNVSYYDDPVIDEALVKIFEEVLREAAQSGGVKRKIDECGSRNGSEERTVKVVMNGANECVPEDGRC